MLDVICKRMQKRELMTEIYVLIPPEQLVFASQLGDLSKNDRNHFDDFTVRNWLQASRQT